MATYRKRVGVHGTSWRVEVCKSGTRISATFPTKAQAQAWANAQESEAAARVGAAMLFAVETAMRAGEICGLTWGEIGPEQKTAHLPMTKNGNARTVPLSIEARRILTQIPREPGNDSVFRLKASQVDALFRKAKARALIDDLHFHDSRREALSRLSKKVDVMELAKISGHRDLRILLTVYYAPSISELADKIG